MPSCSCAHCHREIKKNAVTFRGGTGVMHYHPGHARHHQVSTPADRKRRRRAGWTVRPMTFDEAVEDSAARYARMTPAARVRLVPKLLAACLSTRGIHELPRLHRFYSYDVGDFVF